MSIYHCNECQGQFDSDFVGCNFDPRSEYDLICDDCECDIKQVQERDFIDFLGGVCCA